MAPVALLIKLLVRMTQFNPSRKKKEIPIRILLIFENDGPSELP